MSKSYDTGVLYNTEEAESLPEGMYIGLFHGRNTPDEELNGWGFEGPVIGPLKWVHTTYRNHIRFCPIEVRNGINFEYDEIDLKFFEDMIEYEGKFYGDYTVFHHKRPVSKEIMKARQLWQALGDIPVNDDGEIEEAFEDFTIGTNRLEIWSWLVRVSVSLIRSERFNVLPKEKANVIPAKWSSIH